MSAPAANSDSDERGFLHDLASPLSVAMFLLDSVLEDIQSLPLENKDQLEQLQRAFGALEKMKLILQGRRDVLIKRGVPGA